MLCCCSGEDPWVDNEISAEVHYTEQRDPCAKRDPLRQLFFGDLHAHTAYSWDAYSYYLTVTPAEAYGFATGDPVLLPPLDAQGRGTREVRIGRPLDFAAVTDHGEYLGEVELCRTPGTAAYASASCERFRRMGAVAAADWGIRFINPEGNTRIEDICGADGQGCRDAAKKVWQRIQQAAEDAYDRSSSCAFVSFVGYEYTSTPRITNLHRNVIFRNAQAIELPVTYYEQPSPWGLWRSLDEQCLAGDGACDVLVIPHNANWSNGTLFYPDFEEAPEIDDPAAAARLRARLEPIVEIFQHKGDQECSQGLEGVEAEAACTFEKLRPAPFPDCREITGWGGVQDLGCVSKLDFLRGILNRGMEEQQRLGLNPYRLGVIGSTDTHNGTPGNTWERGWVGHVGTADDTPEERLGEGNITHRGRVNNPGGLAAVWAVERSRDAIFEAMQRREVYATSGTRIALRFFGGWLYPEDSCRQDELPLAELGYRKGVAMGGVLQQKRGEAPVFLVEARWDAGTAERPGTPLQVLQIVKGWVDGAGVAHNRVFDVAGDTDNGASADPATCEQTGGGAELLCAVWRDPSFDPDQRAYYYARVLENPSCRWSTWECNALAAEDRPAGCDDPAIAKTIQERAWSSPIWYVP